VSNAIGRPQTAGGVSRGASSSALLPIGGAAAMGVQSVNNDDDQGPNVATMARSALVVLFPSSRAALVTM